MTGKVFLVGAGPGEKELITVKGIQLLRECDVVVYDRLANPELLEETKAECEKIYVGKQAGRHSMKQEEINSLLVDKAKKGKTVVRLKGGDPFVFGRGGEEAECLLREQIPFLVVPGVTSAVAVPECVGIPVTHRKVSRSFHVITAHVGQEYSEAECEYLEEQIRSLKDVEGTFVFLMGYASLAHICELFIKYGKPSSFPASVIADGTTGKERTVRGTLGTIARLAKQAEMAPPALIVIGETAAYDFCMPVRQESPGRLKGVRVGVTGTAVFAKRLSEKIRAEGGESFYIQELTVKPCEEQKKCFSCIFDKTWIAFTSRNGVRLFFEQMKYLGLDIRLLLSKKFAVIGKGTGETLREYGIYPDYMPDVYTTEALAEGLAGLLHAHDRLLLYQAKEGNPALVDIIEKAGIYVERFDAYGVEGKELSFVEEIDSLAYLCFASSSGVKAFVGKNPDFFENPVYRKIKMIAIGQKTAEELRLAGCRNPLTAKTQDMDGILEVIVTERGNLYDESDAQAEKQ